MAKRATMADTIPIKGHGALPERLASVPEKSKTVPLTFRAPVELHERLRKLAFDTREPIQKIIEQAVSRHLDTVVS
jgi:predicted transcriptional regulator